VIHPALNAVQRSMNLSPPYARIRALSTATISAEFEMQGDGRIDVRRAAC
jgi:hypothetical protein